MDGTNTQRDYPLMRMIYNCLETQMIKFDSFGIYCKENWKQTERKKWTFTVSLDAMPKVNRNIVELKQRHLEWKIGHLIETHLLISFINLTQINQKCKNMEIDACNTWTILSKTKFCGGIKKCLVYTKHVCYVQWQRGED